jgi:hypothetical protein
MKKKTVLKNCFRSDWDQKIKLYRGLDPDRDQKSLVPHISKSRSLEVTDIVYKIEASICVGWVWM